MKITASDVKNFVQGNVNYYITRPDYVTEQATFRAYKCQPCLKAGKCLHCGCTTPQMFFSQSKVDSAKRWGPMMSKEDWEVFKANPTEEYKSFLKSNFTINVKANPAHRPQQELLGTQSNDHSTVPGLPQGSGVIEGNVVPDSTVSP